MNIVWLSFAQKDMRCIREYYEPRAGIDVTVRLLKAIVQTADLLSDQPFLGAPSIDEDVLEIHVPKYPYSLPYRVRGQNIEILRVFHQSQNRPLSWELE